MTVCKSRPVETLLALSFMILGQACKPAEAPKMPPVPVGFVKVASSEVPQISEFTAKVQGTREVEIRARVTGVLLKQFYQEGAAVKAGDLLVRIDPAPYQIALAQAKATLAQEEARALQAKSEAQRQAALLKQKATSEKESSDAQSLAVSTEAARQLAAAKVAQAALDLSYCEVTSPIDGYAGRIIHTEGSLVSPGADGLLTTLVRRDQVWVTFNLSELEFSRLFLGKAAQANQAKVQVLKPDGVAYDLVGKVNFVAAQVDAKMGTVEMRAEFPNPKATLVPGQYVRVRVQGVTVPAAYVIPAVALLQSPQGRFVYVLDDKDLPAIRPVKIDEIQGDKAIVLQGIKDGDRLLVDNLQKVRPGVPVVPHAFTPTK
jgi:membrane fusion protein (multidrug efflux system)